MFEVKNQTEKLTKIGMQLATYISKNHVQKWIKKQHFPPPPPTPKISYYIISNSRKREADQQIALINLDNYVIESKMMVSKVNSCKWITYDR